MVLFFTSAAITPSATIYMGRDKVENEELIKYAWPQDAHVYLRMPEGMVWESIPEKLLIDCAQLVKANSIEGNKKDNLTIIYTPAANLKVTLILNFEETGDMAVGQVSFHNDKKVITCGNTREPIVNRLNKTKVERDVDHEQERVDRVKAENAVKRAAAAEKQDAELAKAREAEKAARSYDILFNQEEEDESVPRKDWARA
ncbi:hypothetical protein CPB84DRAFT_1817617 [Gymnopilus junonius]|uniref:NFACT RNA-binding domain-containing protein n=1 Tax=Gymnopilus junonius TaxID=109634 RepID=A0A9P5N9U6_GYMJU|nr:hypothetical protein CPB84DRAFT_1817617 [Gymnopilus junonius]